MQLGELGKQVIGRRRIRLCLRGGGLGSGLCLVRWLARRELRVVTSRWFVLLELLIDEVYEYKDDEDSGKDDEHCLYHGREYPFVFLLLIGGFLGFEVGFVFSEVRGVFGKGL